MKMNLKIMVFSFFSEKGGPYGGYFVNSIKQEIIRIKKAFTLDDEIKLFMRDIKNVDEYLINIKVKIFGNEEDDKESQLQAEGLSIIINYGIDKLKLSVKDNITNKLEGIVNNRWLFTLENFDMYVKRFYDYFPIVFDLQFKVIDEAAVRPGGKEYLQLKETTKFGKF